MTLPHALKTAGQGLALGGGLAALGYAALVAFHRARYGTVAHTCSMGDDTRLLDRFIPSPEVVDHYRSRIAAPADVVLSTAKEMNRLQSIGWVVLAERAGREVVWGAVMQPWKANLVLRSIPAADFTAFREPGYVKIAWTLRADPITAHQSMFHTETRVSTTDLPTRERFRRHWSFVAPGIQLIRRSLLRPLRRAAERRAAAAQAWTGGAGADLMNASGQPRLTLQERINA